MVFRKAYGLNADGSKRPFYYTRESVGIATGFFIAAVHMMGLVTLTHTPNPMGFLSERLERPANEKPYLILPVGYPAQDAEVPDIHRLPLGTPSPPGAEVNYTFGTRSGTKLAFARKSNWMVLNPGVSGYIPRPCLA